MKGVTIIKKITKCGTIKDLKENFQSDVKKKTSIQHKITDRLSTQPVRVGRVGIWAPAHWGLGEIGGLLVSPGKASNRPTDHLITG